MLTVVVFALVAQSAAPVAVAPKDAASKRVLAYLNDAIAAGDDAVRVRAVLKKWHAPAAFKSYVEQQRSCMGELRQGGAPSAACRGNGLSCSAGPAVVVALTAAGKGAFTADVVEADGSHHAIALTVAGKSISTIRCGDSDLTQPQRTPAHCEGDVGSCDGRCGEPGCRAAGDRCEGTPLPCAERTSFFTCNGGCVWIPEQ